MTEKEKMLRGMLYAPAHDETLLAELAACKAQCQQFNQRAYQAEGIESAQMLLRRLLGLPLPTVLSKYSRALKKLQLAWKEAD